ncbi:hypothetical protein LJC45_04360 [Alistipes sp. OttesenSCG-928-B03]|nr:hypothetical protein [Alistipes sp. OttesenSCG-928-B03]
MTIAENARRNNVSVAAIRYHIQSNNIDRRYEAKITIVNKIRRIIAKEPSLSMSQIAKAGGCSLNTVKKYMPYATREIELSKSDKVKLSNIDIRQLRDYYATAPSVTTDILREEQFNRLILEPCCGGGFMAEEIRKAGYRVDASDLIDRGYGRGGIDFLKTDWEVGKYDIITNPPYSLFIPILKQAMRICHNKVAMLLPLRYLSSKERFAVFQKFPPARVYAYVNRICIAKNGRFSEYDSGMNLEIYAWYIWERGYKGDTILKWIHNAK